MTPEALYCGPPVSPAALAEAWRLDPTAAALVLGLLVLGHVRAAPRGPVLGAAALIGVLYLSPLCALAAGLFSARAAHHALLVAVAAPLLALAFPARAPRGLWPALALMTASLWAWHLPAAYAWGVVGALPYWTMQATLLAPALVFWRAALAPGEGDRWGETLVALLLAGMQMGMLGALLTFAGRPLYGVHLLTTAPWGLTALEDQQLAGLVMWVPGALPWLTAAAAIAWTALRPPAAGQAAP